MSTRESTRLHFDKPGYVERAIPPLYEARVYDQSTRGSVSCVGLWDEKGRLIELDWMGEEPADGVTKPFDGDWPAVKVSAMIRPSATSRVDATLAVYGYPTRYRFPSRTSETMVAALLLLGALAMWLTP